MQALFGGRDLVVLDGGTGTTLQDAFGADISSRLWSAGLLRNDPDTLKKLVQAWEEAGAEIIETCTYQATVDGLAELPPASSPTDAITLLLSSIILTHSALGPSRSTKICLSLGPYGATLQPSREYTGLYYPPFGYSPSPLLADSSPLKDKMKPLLDPEASLAHFHRTRLTAFASSPSHWSVVSCLALETIPSLTEALAVRRAVGSLPPEVPPKPWVTSFVFPGEGGSFPTPASRETPTPEDVLEAALAVLPSNRASLDPSVYARPSAVGINCTKPSFLPCLVRRWTSHLPSLLSTSAAEKADKPWLWLYPDGGKTYDIVTRTWSGEKSGGVEEWAKKLVDVAEEVREAGVWGGVVVGGCCKVGLEHVKALRCLVDDLRG